MSKPGPGAYEPKITSSAKNSPSFRVGSSSREQYYQQDK